jgi:hypothetical protein
MQENNPTMTRAKEQPPLNYIPVEDEEGGVVGTVLSVKRKEG